MTRDKDEASDNKFGPDFEEKESKPRSNDDANEAPNKLTLTPKVEDDTR